MEQIDTFVGIIAPFTNFIIFLVLAFIFFRKPAAAAATKKREEFQKVLEEAQKTKRDAETQLAQLNDRMAQLDAELASIRANAKITADAEAAQIVADAERLAGHLRDEARRIADAEVDKARATLRNEIIAAVKENVTNRARAELDKNSHLELVKKRIGGLASMRADA